MNPGSDPVIDAPSRQSSHRRLFRMGAWSCILLIAYSVATMLVMLLLGGPPTSAADAFAMLGRSKLEGLLRMDVLTLFLMPLYYLLFYSLWLAMRPSQLVTISTLLVFVGLTLFLATPSAFSYLNLSDRFSLADEEQRRQLLAAGEAIFASDLWHGSGARIGGLLLQIGALFVSVGMLRDPAFTRRCAWIGISTHGLDLAHILVGFFLPPAGDLLMAIAGPLYLVWFPLIALRLFALGGQRRPPAAGSPV